MIGMRIFWFLGGLSISSRFLPIKDKRILHFLMNIRFGLTPKWIDVYDSPAQWWIEHGIIILLSNRSLIFVVKPFAINKNILLSLMNRLYFGFEIEVVQIIALLHRFSLYFEYLRVHLLTFMPLNIINYLVWQIWLKQLLFVLLSTPIDFGQQKLIFSSLSEVLTCHSQLFLGNNINFDVLLRATFWIKWRLDVLSHDHTSACSKSLSLLIAFVQYLMSITAVLINYWIHFWDDAALMPGISRILPIIARHWTFE